MQSEEIDYREKTLKLRELIHEAIRKFEDDELPIKILNDYLSELDSQTEKIAKELEKISNLSQTVEEAKFKKIIAKFPDVNDIYIYRPFLKRMIAMERQILAMRSNQNHG